MRTFIIKFAGIGVAALTLVAFLSVLRIPLVAALTDATSTEPMSSSTVNTTVVTNTLPTSTPSIAEGSPVATTSIDVLPVSATDTLTVEPVPAAQLPMAPEAPEVIEKSISALQDSYHQKTGKYLQVIPGNVLPSYESGSVQEKLGTTIPQNVQVDVYDAPTGSGYQITFEQNGTQYSFGYGPEAAHRTYAIPPASLTSATSTVAVQ